MKRKMCRSNDHSRRVLNRELNPCWLSHNACIPYSVYNHWSVAPVWSSNIYAGAFRKPKSKLFNFNLNLPWPSTGLLCWLIVLQHPTAWVAHFHSFQDRWQVVRHDQFVSQTTTRSRQGAGEMYGLDSMMPSKGWEQSFTLPNRGGIWYQQEHWRTMESNDSLDTMTFNWNKEALQIQWEKKLGTRNSDFTSFYLHYRKWSSIDMQGPATYHQHHSPINDW